MPACVGEELAEDVAEDKEEALEEDATVVVEEVATNPPTHPAETPTLLSPSKTNRSFSARTTAAFFFACSPATTIPNSANVPF